MSIYSENKTVVNKIIALLNKKDIQTELGVGVYFKDIGKFDSLIVRLYYRKDGGVRTIETKDKFIFGWNMKMSSVQVNEDTLIKETLNNYGHVMNNEQKEGFIEEMVRAGVKQSDVSELESTNKMGSTLGYKNYDVKKALEYKPFSEFYNKNSKGLMDASNYTIRRYPTFFKTLSDKNIIPAAFLDSDGRIFMVSPSAKDYKRGASLSKLFTEIRVTSLNSDTFDSLSYGLPIGDNTWKDNSSWEIVDVNIPSIDNDYFHMQYFE